MHACSTHSRTPRIVSFDASSKSFAPRRSPSAVKSRSMRAFQLLGEAEAAIHSIPIEKVHFHEVGAVDTIVDIVCAAAGAEALGVDRWLASPLNVGSGTVVCQHGTLPVPAPATLALLGDAPVYAAGPPMERVTPTGAALLRMLDVRYAPLPADAHLKHGLRRGRARDAGPAESAAPAGGRRELRRLQQESIAVIETVIDDCNPQVLGLRQREAARGRRVGCLSRRRADEEGPHRRADDRALPARSRPRAARVCSSARPPPSACAGGWRTRSHWRASLLKSRRAGAKCSIKIARWPEARSPTPRRSMRIAAKLPTQHSVPLKQVMEEAMRALRAPSRRIADGSRPDRSSAQRSARGPHRRSTTRLTG